jgi:hypothetical protein
MKLTSHPFKSDIVTLTWRDLLKLMLGRELQASGLVVRRKSNGS